MDQTRCQYTPVIIHNYWSNSPNSFIVCACVRACVYRKREEEQRRREAEQQISLASAEQRKMPPERVEHRRHSLANKMNGLALHDPAVEPRKSSKAERLRAKEELGKQKGMCSHVRSWFNGKIPA